MEGLIITLNVYYLLGNDRGNDIQFNFGDGSRNQN